MEGQGRRGLGPQSARKSRERRESEAGTGHTPPGVRDRRRGAPRERAAASDGTRKKRRWCVPARKAGRREFFGWSCRLAPIRLQCGQGEGQMMDTAVDRERLLSRITADPHVLVGKPTIRGMRISVEQILDALATGVSEEDLRTIPRSSPTTSVLPCFSRATYRASYACAASARNARCGRARVQARAAQTHRPIQFPPAACRSGSAQSSSGTLLTSVCVPCERRTLWASTIRSRSI